MATADSAGARACRGKENRLSKRAGAKPVQDVVGPARAEGTEWGSSYVFEMDPAAKTARCSQDLNSEAHGSRHGT